MTDIKIFLILQRVHMLQQKRRRKYKEGYYDAIREVYNFVKQMEENMSKEMTAVEFLKAKNRICKFYDDDLGDCFKCPIGNADGGCQTGSRYNKINTEEEIVARVQKWAERHPINTRQSEFLRHYPNAKIHDGVIKLCPRDINTDLDCRGNSERISCDECQKDYWLKEVE